MNHIFLVGFMGAGKSTLGVQLANHLQLPFIDSDDYISRDHKMSVSKLFALEGESYFRSCEKEFIKKLEKEPRSIVATGGGLPCFNNLMEKLKKIGVVIYLNCSIETLVSRLENEVHLRPLLQNNKTLKLSEFIIQSLSQRDPIYKQAQIILDEKQLNLEYIVQQLEAIKG